MISARMRDEMSPPGAERAADPAMVRAAVARVAQNGDVQERETHISHLFLTTDRAFKLKKPLTLDFLDYGTAARRRALCFDEVRLNSRLAPSLYLGVRALVAGENGLEFAEPETSGAIDYVVEMRLYDEDQTLSAALARGDLDTREIEQLGDKLAAFHANCRPVRVEGGAERAASLIERNLSEFPGACAELFRAVRAFGSASTDADVCPLQPRGPGSPCRPGASAGMSRRPPRGACDPQARAQRGGLRRVRT